MSRLERLLGCLPLHPWLIALAACLGLWHVNQNRLAFDEVAPVIGLILAVQALLVAALVPLVGGWLKAAFATSLVTAVVLLPSLLAMLPGGATVEATALVADLGIVGYGIWRLRQATADQARPTALLNLVFLALAAYQGAQLAMAPQATGGRPEVTEIFSPLAATEPAAAEAPDFWHLVFDRYGDAETLARAYDFDNRPFLAALAERGFAVPEGAANYQRTAHSLASTLNLDYLDQLASRMEGAGADWVPLYGAIRESRAFRFLRDAGYEVHHFGSWWDPTRGSPLAHHNHSFRALPEFGRRLLESSMVGRALALAGLPYGDGRRDQCERTRFQFVEMEALAASPRRKYVFAHMLVPHPPFVIDQDGDCKSLVEAEATTRRNNYIDQLVYANRELLELIDAILAGPRPAVIILQADEGPWPEPYVGDERFLARDPVPVDWTLLTRDQLREKMRILYAVRAPDPAPLQLGRTPVNLYRILFDRYFGTHLLRLPDASYVFLANDRLYDFLEVSDQVH